MAEPKTCKKNYSKLTTKNLMRQKITHEAVLLITQMGINDLHYAKTKASKKYAINDPRLLPSNEEILHELKHYHNLFSTEEQIRQEKEWQRQVLKIMHKLHKFNPRMADNGVGYKLFPNSAIEIFISAPSLEEICIFLLDENIPYNLKEKKIFIAKNRTQNVPYFDLSKEQYKIQLTFLTLEKPPIRPINPIDNKPFQYLNIKKVEEQFEMS